MFICATVVCSLVVASYVANVSLCLGLLIWTATGLLVVSLSSFVLLLLQLVIGYKILTDCNKFHSYNLGI